MYSFPKSVDCIHYCGAHLVLQPAFLSTTSIVFYNNVSTPRTALSNEPENLDSEKVGVASSIPASNGYAALPRQKLFTLLRLPPTSGIAVPVALRAKQRTRDA